MSTWCAVQTHSRAEERAAHHLTRQGFQVFLPRYLKRRRHARRTDWLPAPLFPRYLFVGLDPRRTPWRAIMSTVGVSRLVCFDDQPARVPNAVIDEIRARQDDRGLIGVNPMGALARGDRVQVIDGPFNALDGLFDGVSDDRRVTVLLELMGRQVRVRVPMEAVHAAV